MSEPQSFDDALDVYVPGAWRCPKCSFALQKATMFVQSGTIGSTRADVMNVSGETCPNDGEPMLRETWHQRSEDNYKWGVGLMEEIIALTGAEHLPGAIDKIKALVGAPLVADSAEILSAERSTSVGPRDEASSSSLLSDGRAAALDAAPSSPFVRCECACGHSISSHNPADGSGSCRFCACKKFDHAAHSDGPPSPEGAHD